MRFGNWLHYILITGGAAAPPVLWTLIPFAADSLGNGTDDKAGNAIQEVTLHYQRWFESLWSPNPVVERTLFTAQALGGARVFLGAIRILRERGGREQ